MWVSTVAADGVDVVKGEHLLVADSAGDLAADVLRVMTNRDERERLAEAGRASDLASSLAAIDAKAGRHYRGRAPALSDEASLSVGPAVS